MTHGRLPPRYFWRRLGAYLIDLTIIWVAYSILVTVFSGAIPAEGLRNTVTETNFGFELKLGNFQPPIYVGRTTCGEADDTGGQLASYFAPYETSNIRTCWQYMFGILQEGEVTAELKDPANPTQPAQTGTVTLIPYEPLARYQSLFTLAAYIALAIACLRLWAQTPGKRLMGLRLVSQTPIAAAKRELVRNLPWILTVVPTALANWRAVEAFVYAHLQTIQVIGTVLQFFGIASLIGLWVFPLIRWRGAMPYDRWIGVRQIRQDVDPVS